MSCKARRARLIVIVWREAEARTIEAESTFTHTCIRPSEIHFAQSLHVGIIEICNELTDKEESFLNKPAEP